MDDDPPGTQQCGRVDVGTQIGIHRLAHERRIFGDIYRRQCMQAQTDTVVVARRADCSGPRGVEAADDVGPGVELDVDDAHALRAGPVDRILQPKLAADIDADAFGRDHGHGSVQIHPAGGAPMGARDSSSDYDRRGRAMRSRRGAAPPAGRERLRCHRSVAK